MGNTSYEMIEGQAGGGAVPANSGTAGLGEGEASSLIPGSKPTRQRWMVGVAVVVMAGAFVGAFASSGRFSAATGADAQGSTSSASGDPSILLFSNCSPLLLASLLPWD